jgi:alpha-ketoglutarate-dependent taurine dioxygenase
MLVLRYQRMQIVDIDGGFAGRVTDLRLAEASQSKPQLIRALAERGVLLFTDLDLSLEDQRRLAECFGGSRLPHREPLGRDAISAFRDGDGQASDPMAKELQLTDWHSDTSYLQNPMVYTFLYCITAPSAGWGTDFANLALAYDALPEPLRRTTATLRGVHQGYGSIPAGAPAIVRPLVHTHPVTGRPSLYFGKFCSRIEGLAPDASDALLAELLAHATQPRFVYAHRWRAGDLLVWDNRCTVHRRNPYLPEGVTRELRKLQSCGEFWQP